MDIKGKLKDYCVEEKCITVAGRTYSYLLATYSNKQQFIAAYYILDLANNEEYADCEKNWSDTKVFEEFEQELLEDDFFAMPGDNRFNLYLVLIVKENSAFLYDSSIRNDFRYARKIILTEKQMDDFFGDVSIKRENTPYFSGKVAHREIMDNLRLLGAQGHEILGEELPRRLYFNYSKQKKSPIDEDMMKLINLYQQFKECIPDKLNEEQQSTEKLSGRKYLIKSVEKVTIENYRMMTGQRTIPFGRVNLLFGDNGVGKTTILDAIELGITGMNRKMEEVCVGDAKIEVECKNGMGMPIFFCSDKEYVSLAKDWYGIKADNKVAFNKMFNQYNYFDTGFASAFAIEGQRQINLWQLQEFLGIDKIENGERILGEFYELLEKVALGNVEATQTRRGLFSKKRNTKYPLPIERYDADISMRNAQRCQGTRKRLKEEIEVISLEETLNAHIKKIEGIFKLLIASNEYEMLKVVDGEIVAIRSSNGEEVSMAKMSTGQKVCLALAFMFDLFLSNSQTPNIILLDEPAANLDDLHMLNLLDTLRKMALSGTQIFFTTANPNVAQLFRRKFSFFEEDFKYFSISETEQKYEIKFETFVPTQEAPKKKATIPESYRKGTH